MQLALFALALVSLPATPTPQTPVEPRSPPVVAALTFSRLLGDLRDSLGRSRTVDSALAIEIRSLLPTASAADRTGKEYELSLALTLGPDALPRFIQILDHLASGKVKVSDLRLSAEGELTDLADQMLRVVADSGGAPPTGRGTVGRLGRIALILLAIRREVRQ